VSLDLTKAAEWNLYAQPLPIALMFGALIEALAGDDAAIPLDRSQPIALVQTTAGPTLRWWVKDPQHRGSATRSTQVTRVIPGWLLEAMSDPLSTPEGIRRRAREARTLHNPWDGQCVKNGIGEPSREGERCLPCRPLSQVSEPVVPE